MCNAKCEKCQQRKSDVSYSQVLRMFICDECYTDIMDDMQDAIQNGDAL